MPDAQLRTPDLIIVGLYIALMTLLGAWFTRRQKDRKAYFVGDRNVGWFMVLVSIVATETSAVTFLSVPGVAYNPAGGNFTFLQLALGYIVGRCLVSWLLLPMYMQGELFSAYQVLRTKFGPAVQRTASALFLLTRTLADGLRLFLTALVMQYVGWGVETAVVVVGVVTILYTFLGGMKAVLWTDLIQFVIKISGAALAGIFVLSLLPGGWENYLRIGAEAKKFTFFNLSFDPTNDATLWAGLVGGAVFSMASHGADQLMVQRYLCARSLFDARLALVLSGFTVFLQFVLFLGVGVGIFALVSLGIFVPGAAKNDEVFGLFIVTQLPTGVVGVLVAAILAAAMSTLSSSLNSSANALMTDFYQPLRPNLPEAHYVQMSRGMTVFWGVAQIGVALGAYQFGGDVSVVKRVLAIAGLTTGLVLGLFLLGRRKHPVSTNAALCGLGVGFLTVLAVWSLNLASVAEFVRNLLPGTFDPDKTIAIAWPWYAPLGAATTVSVALVSGAFFKRTDGPTPTPPDRSA